MGKTSWLAGPSVDGDPDVKYVSDVTEKLVEISIGHLESKVADKEGLGWWVHALRAVTGLVYVVDNEAAAFVDLLMLGFNGSGCLVNGLIFNVTKSL